MIMKKKAILLGMAGLLSLGTGTALAANNLPFESEAASASTFRVWFYRYTHYANMGDDWKIWDNTNDIVYSPTYVTHDGLTMLYFDLPTSINTITFQTFSNGDWKSNANVVNYSAGKNSKVWYPYWNGDKYDIITTGIESSFKFKIWHLKDVFASYLTCSSDKNNGYGDFDTLYKTWIYDGATCKIDGYNETTLLAALESENLNENDFSWSESGGTISYNYSDASSKTKTVSVADKIGGLKKEYEKSQSGGARFSSAGIETDKNTPIVITFDAIGLVALAGSGILFARRKRKQD